MSIRANLFKVITTLVLLLVACSKQTDVVHLDPPSSTARPALKNALQLITTPTRLGDNFGVELQVACRLHLVTYQLEFKPLLSDDAEFRKVMTNTTVDVYGRICAAAFLINTDEAARAMLADYLASTNLRHRFNAARAIQWMALDAQDEARAWTQRQLVQALESRGLEIRLGTYTPSPGFHPTMYDLEDDMATPLEYVCATLGKIKSQSAVPVLKAMSDRGSPDAVQALGAIGDPATGPFLLEQYRRNQDRDARHALAAMKYTAATPLMIAELNTADAAKGLQVMEDLLAMGDQTAVGDMQRFVAAHPATATNFQKEARIILVQMSDPDPAGTLLTLLASETDQRQQIDLIWALSRFRDSRAVERLTSMAVEAESTVLRRAAIYALRQMGGQPALLALVTIMESKATPPVHFDKPAILDGRQVDFSKVNARHALRDATRQSFGTNAAQWRHWIAENR